MKIYQVICGQGHKSKIKIIVYDDLNQEGVVETDLIFPEKNFCRAVRN